MNRNGELATSRLQRLQTLENEIRSGMEEFFRTGMKLKEIRDDELFKEDGFDTWEKYCKERWEWSRQRAHQLITASEYRQKIPTSTNVDVKWSEGSIRELTRIPDKQEAARVAKKIIAKVEKEDGPKLTAKVVRKVVDEELGVQRPKPPPELPDLLDVIRGWTERMDRWNAELEQIIPHVGYIDTEPQVAKRFRRQAKELIGTIRRLLEVGPPPEDKPEGQPRGVGVNRANEAIDCLKRIPKNDGLRKRGFQIVTDWISHNE